MINNPAGGNFNLSLHYTSVDEYIFRFSGPRVWNSSPGNVRDAPSRTVLWFVNRLESHLFKCVFFHFTNTVILYTIYVMVFRIFWSMLFCQHNNFYIFRFFESMVTLSWSCKSGKFHCSRMNCRDLTTFQSVSSITNQVSLKIYEMLTWL